MKILITLANTPTSLIKLIDPPMKKTMVKRLSTKRLQNLGWSPSVELPVGMRIVYDWIKKFEWHD